MIEQIEVVEVSQMNDLRRLVMTAGRAAWAYEEVATKPAERMLGIGGQGGRDEGVAAAGKKRRFAARAALMSIVIDESPEPEVADPGTALVEDLRDRARLGDSAQDPGQPVYRLLERSAGVRRSERNQMPKMRRPDIAA